VIKWVAMAIQKYNIVISTFISKKGQSELFSQSQVLNIDCCKGHCYEQESKQFKDQMQSW
jgi:hypothetical protein